MVVLLALTFDST